MAERRREKHQILPQNHNTNKNAQYYLLYPKARGGGERVEDHVNIEHEFTNYFQEVLREPQIDRRNAIEKVTQYVPKVIIEDHNQILLRTVMPEEVDLAMK